MKDILVKKAIEILEDLKPVDKYENDVFKTWAKAVREEIDKKIRY